MQPEPCVRAAARTIYDACFTDEIAPYAFEDAEKYDTVHYRRAVEAARGARLLFVEEPSLF
jgi:hypothetical protein